MSAPGPDQLDERILELCRKGEGAPRDDAAFDSLARDLFAHQYAHNEPYRRLCDAEGVTPASLASLSQIPACPTDAFREFDLTTFPTAEAAVRFDSSGTIGDAPIRHFLPHVKLYEAALLESFAWYVMPDTKRMRLLVLFPTPGQAPHSSLAHMLGEVAQHHGGRRVQWAVPDPDEIVPVYDVLRHRQASGKPLMILGTAFSFVHLCDGLEDLAVDFQLPPGSRAMETGGYKGHSRELLRDDLYSLIHRWVGIPEAMIVNEYGMTEMGSQFYDATLRAALGLPAEDDRVKRPPPWVRSWVVEPADPTREVADGAEGILKHLDLVNRGSVCCLLTADRGRRVGDGFEVLGRASGAALRGCSLRLEELRRG